MVEDKASRRMEENIDHHLYWVPFEWMKGLICDIFYTRNTVAASFYGGTPVQGENVNWPMTIIRYKEHDFHF